MRERVVFVVDAPDDQVGPLDRDALTAAIAGATGLTATCVGGGADIELPHEDIPGGPVWKDMPPVWAHVDVGAAMLDTAAMGRVPALYFRFYSPTGEEQQGAFLGLERQLHAFATLTRNAVASAISNTAQARRDLGQGPLPTLPR